MKARVIDLSHHNSIPQDLRATKAAGIVGVIHKLTEGIGYIDDKATARRWLAQDAGLAWGLYHFLRPGDMEAQARFFVDTAADLNVMDDDTLLVADHEDGGVSLQDLQRFVDAVESAADRSPAIYSGHLLKEQMAGSGYHLTRRLWLAQYSATPELPDGVDNYWLWQYSQTGEVPGVTPPTDVNTFEGSDADFLAGWAGTEAPPPVQDVPTLTITSDKPVKIQLGPNIKIV